MKKMNHWMMIALGSRCKAEIIIDPPTLFMVATIKIELNNGAGGAWKKVVTVFLMSAHLLFRYLSAACRPSH